MGFVRRLFGYVYRYSRYFYPRQQIEIAGQQGLRLYVDFQAPRQPVVIDFPELR